MNDASEPLPYLRRNFQGLRAWNPTQLLPGERDGKVHRMDLNECPMPPSPKVVQAIRDHADKVNRYGDGGCPALTARMTEITGIPAERICWGTGSAELLGNIIRAAVAPGDMVVAPTPVWRRFAGVFNAVEADVAHVANRPDGAVDPEAMVSAIGPKTRVVIVVSPNNPTGGMLTADEIAYLARAVPDEVLLYLDEAYFEFARHAGGPDGLEILKAERPGPWAVTRTFSKAYAMAGMRLGYAMTSKTAIADALRALGGNFNVSGLAEMAALAALDDPDYAEEIQVRTATERQRIVDGFRALGIEPLPSVTNFVSAPLPVPAAEVQQAMRERLIRVGTWSEPGFEHMLRVSVGLPADTDAFLAALKEILAERG